MSIKDPYIQGQGAAAVVAPAAQQEAASAPPARENTSPTFSPHAAKPGDGVHGVETARTSDKLGRKSA